MKDKKKRSKKEIQRENDELKSKLSQEFGGMLGNDSDLPPEIENEFLRNVVAFEQQFAEGKEITVYERIGSPGWVPMDKMADVDIGHALTSLMDLLYQNGISIDTICDVEESEMYRFITEELFNEEILDLSIDGMMTCFIYEEFHPNHEYDSEQSARDFITTILPENVDTDDWYFNEDIKVKLSPQIHTEEKIRKIKIFMNAYSGFEIHHLEIISLDLTEDVQEANVIFEIRYDADMEDNADTISFDGLGRMKLQNVFERLGVAGWDVLALEMPGFKL